MDIIITFMNHQYVLELKRWYGEEAHQRGLKQLAGYLEAQGLEKGSLIIFDFSKDKAKTWSEDRVTVEGKEIQMVRI